MSTYYVWFIIIRYDICLLSKVLICQRSQVQTQANPCFVFTQYQIFYVSQEVVPESPIPKSSLLLGQQYSVWYCLSIWCVYLYWLLWQQLLHNWNNQKSVLMTMLRYSFIHFSHVETLKKKKVCMSKLGSGIFQNNWTFYIRFNKLLELWIEKSVFLNCKLAKIQYITRQLNFRFKILPCTTLTVIF